MTRTDIRRRALRAAAAVSLTTLSVGLLACDGTVLIDESDTTEEPVTTAPTPDPTPTPTSSASAPTTPILPVVIADAGADAPDCACPEDATWEECCAQLDWSFECGCGAWGPPMPPAMEVA